MSGWDFPISFFFEDSVKSPKNYEWNDFVSFIATLQFNSLVFIDKEDFKR